MIGADFRDIEYAVLAGSSPVIALAGHGAQEVTGHISGHVPSIKAGCVETGYCRITLAYRRNQVFKILIE